MTVYGRDVAVLFRAKPCASLAETLLLLAAPCRLLNVSNGQRTTPTDRTSGINHTIPAHSSASSLLSGSELQSICQVGQAANPAGLPPDATYRTALGPMTNSKAVAAPAEAFDDYREYLRR